MTACHSVCMQLMQGLQLGIKAVIITLFSHVITIACLFTYSQHPELLAGTTLQHKVRQPFTLPNSRLLLFVHLCTTISLNT
jgi:hypothetical protein